MVISGKELAAACKAKMAEQVKTFPGKYGRLPHLVVVLVGEDAGSVSYVTGKTKAADEVVQESTYWSTTKDTPYPHSVVIDLGSTRTLTGIQYLPRMESEVPGGIKDFKVYVKSKAFNY